MNKKTSYKRDRFNDEEFCCINVTILIILNKILNKKHCIIISHDEQFIHSICDQVLELDSKSIMQNPDLVREQR